MNTWTAIEYSLLTRCLFNQWDVSFSIYPEPSHPSLQMNFKILKRYFLTCFHLTCILLLLFVANLRARLLKLNPLLMPLHIVTEPNASDTRLGAALEHLWNNIAADYASCLRWARSTEDVGRQSLSRTLLLHPSGRTHKCRHFHLNVNWSLLTWWGWKTSPDCRSGAPGKRRCLFNSASLAFSTLLSEMLLYRGPKHGDVRRWMNDMNVGPI